jgi:hypothetical protein
MQIQNWDVFSTQLLLDPLSKGSEPFRVQVLWKLLRDTPLEHDCLGQLFKLQTIFKSRLL